MSIYVGNLSYDVTKEDLNEVFTDYGEVKRVHIPTDRDTGRMRGFAFVEMNSDDQEEQAISTLDGAEWMGRTLKVNKAKVIGYACIIDRSIGKSKIKDKIVSQVQLDIPTYKKDNLPKELISIQPIKPGSRNL